MINLLKKEWNSGDNLNGEKIKIIIGSEVTSEGIDFQGIREIHILDPWYNLNRLEQVIGRGIRYCSHIKLPVEHRNVSIYLHISNINDEDACIDESIYQLAERKAINIGKIESILKINSIDSYLFLKGNIITKGNISPIKLIDSRNNNLNAYYPYDREYSKLCSYMETCIYNPNISDTNLIKLEKLKEKDIDFDTFNIDLSSEITETVYKYIQELFKIDNIFTIDNIIDYINDNLNIHHKIIFLSLNYIIDKKITLYGINDIKGYIIYRNDYYIFQPEIYNDEYLPIYYRYNLINNNITHLSIDSILDDEEDIIEIDESNVEYEEILLKVNKLVNDYNNLKILKDHKLNDKKLIFEYIIDRLDISEKKILIDKILIDKNINIDIFNYFSKNFIYNDNGNYIIGKNIKNNDIIGYGLSNDKGMVYYINGEIAKDIIKDNINKNLKNINIIDKEIWGYTLNLKGEIIFKLVDEKLKSRMKFKGTILQNISNKQKLIDYIKNYFPKYFNDKIHKKLPKSDILLLIEFIIRKENIFINSDLIHFKYNT